jgi:hypothetical protein
MTTLRTFDHSGAAEIAKSVLDANGIFCSLVDENAHLYLLAAVPIRLLVAEDHWKRRLGFSIRSKSH